MIQPSRQPLYTVRHHHGTIVHRHGTDCYRYPAPSMYCGTLSAAPPLTPSQTVLAPFYTVTALCCTVTALCYTVMAPRAHRHCTVYGFPTLECTILQCCTTFRTVTGCNGTLSRHFCTHHGSVLHRHYSTVLHRQPTGLFYCRVTVLHSHGTLSRHRATLPWYRATPSPYYANCNSIWLKCQSMMA